jgi:SAM-dependent methyltransferase
MAFLLRRGHQERSKRKDVPTDPMADLYQLGEADQPEAHTYRAFSQEPSYIREILAPFIQRQQQMVNPVVLDIGCGTGEAADQFEKNGIPTIRLDYNLPVLRQQHSTIDQLKVVQGNAWQLPLAAQTLTGIHVKDVLVHISRRQQFWREVARVLRPGGLVLLTTSTARCSGSYYFNVDIVETMALASCFSLRTIERQSWLPLELGTDWYGWRINQLDKDRVAGWYINLLILATRRSVLLLQKEIV